MFPLPYPRRFLVMVASLVLTASSPADVVTFDQYVNGNNNDFANFFYTSGTVNQSPTGGISGGMVPNFGLGTTGAYLLNFTMPVGGITDTIYFKYDSTSVPPIASSGATARIGFFNDSTTSFENSSLSANYFHAEFYNDTHIGLFTGVSPVHTVTLAQPTFGDWLALSFTAVSTGGSQFQISALLQDFGPSGVAMPVVLASDSTSVSSAAAAADSSLYAGFGGWYHFSAADNFSVSATSNIPEPATITLFGVSVLALAVCRPRRQLFPGN